MLVTRNMTMKGNSPNTAQSLIASAYAVWVCGLDVEGSLGLLVTVAVVDAVLGATLGLCWAGFSFPGSRCLWCWKAVSDWLPLSHAVEALNLVADGSGSTAEIIREVGILAAFAVVFVVLGAVTLRRRTP